MSQGGQVQISLSSAAGERVVAKLGPGEFFGEMSVVLGEARTVRAVSVGRTELLELDGETQQRDIEGIEHHLSRDTVRSLEDLASFFESNPEVLKSFLKSRTQAG